MGLGLGDVWCGGRGLGRMVGAVLVPNERRMRCSVGFSPPPVILAVVYIRLLLWVRVVRLLRLVSVNWRGCVGD